MVIVRRSGPCLAALTLLVAAMLSSCIISRSYAPDTTLTAESCAGIFDRVLMSLPRGGNPDYVEMTPAYLEYGRGAGPGSVVDGVGRQRYDVERLYFNELGESRLYKSWNWFVVWVYSKEDQRLARFKMFDGEKARKLVDAFASMRARAPEPFAE